MWSSQEPDDFSAASEGSSTSNQLRYLIKETLSTVFKAAALAFLIIYFVAQTNIVYGASMEPTLHERQRLIVEKVSYRLITPKRGDVVVVAVPDSPVPLIKRVVGLPGETVEISNGKIKIYNDKHPNGMLINETSYLDQDFTANSQTVTLKMDEYYVLGDNRSSSLDSRFFGPVNKSYVVGRVWLRGFPFDRWKHFTSFDYELDK